MKKITHKFHHYTAVLEPDTKNGGFTVTIPALPGCISEGDTFEEAIVNVEEAAELYVEVMRSHKAEVPQEGMGIIFAPIAVRA